MLLPNSTYDRSSFFFFSNLSLAKKLSFFKLILYSLFTSFFFGITCKSQSTNLLTICGVPSQVNLGLDAKRYEYLCTLINIYLPFGGYTTVYVEFTKNQILTANPGQLGHRKCHRIILQSKR